MNRGEDKIVLITLTDESGTVIDPASFVGLIVEVYQQKDKVIEKYSMNAASGYQTINNINSVAGTFEINLKRSTFQKYLQKKLLAEVKTSETNADFEDGVFVTISNPFEIDTLYDVATTDEDIP